MDSHEEREKHGNEGRRCLRLSACPPAAKTTMIRRRVEDGRAYGLSHALVLYRHTVCVQNLAELERYQEYKRACREVYKGDEVQ
jgi:hypothetical protein